MPAREAPSYSSSRVQRASRLNALETVRLQQRLHLLEKARLHQARLTNQDIRLTSLALEYILNCSGHSPEGRGPEGQQGSAAACDLQQDDEEEEPYFLYGERVASRRARRMPRPQSALERSTGFRPPDADSLASGPVSASPSSAAGAGQDRLPPRPQSSPAKGRSWGSWGRRDDEEEADRASAFWDFEAAESRPVSSRGAASSPGSRPSTPGSVSGWSQARGPGPKEWGRATPRQAWEDDTDEITRRLLKARQERLQQEQAKEKEQARRRSRRYREDLARSKSASLNAARRSSIRSQALPAEDIEAEGTVASRVPAATATTPYVIEDRKPMPPAGKQGPLGHGSAAKRAGLADIMSQARSTMSAGAWRSHLSSTHVPRSAGGRQQQLLQAKKEAERLRQRQVQERVDSFVGHGLANDTGAAIRPSLAPELN